MKEEFLFFPKIHMALVWIVLIITGLPAAYFLIEKASGGAVALGWFCSFTALMGTASYCARYEMRSVIVEHDVVKFESASSSPGKFRAFTRSELDVVEVDRDVLLVESGGKKVAVLRRSTIHDYLWERLRERLDKTVPTSEMRPIFWHVYNFTPRQTSYIVSITMIYALTLFIGFGLIFHVGLDIAINLAWCGYLPAIFVATFLTRKELLKLTLSEIEVEVHPSGSIPVLPGRRRVIPRQSAVLEILSDRVQIKDQGDVVGIIRKNSARKEDWKKLLADIAEYEAVGCHAVPAG